MSDPKQQTLFSARQTRRVWLERLMVPRFERATTGGPQLARTAKIKHLLRVIESHASTGGPCRLKLATVSHEMGVSDRTTRRAISDAVQCGLLKFTPSFTKTSASEFEIDWYVVKSFILECPMTSGLIDPHAPKPMPRDETTPVNLSATPVNLSATPVNLSATPVNLSRVDAGHTMYSRVRPNHSSTMIKPNEEPSLRNDVFSNFGNMDESRTKTGKFNNGGWPFQIAASDLSRPSRVQQLWVHALQRDWGFTPEMRVNFFVAARVVRKLHEAKPLDNPGAYFTTAVRAAVQSGKWPGTNEDEDAARIAIRLVDSGKVMV